MMASIKMLRKGPVADTEQWQAGGRIPFILLGTMAGTKNHQTEATSSI
jgi:hypothetical protein